MLHRWMNLSGRALRLWVRKGWCDTREEAGVIMRSLRTGGATTSKRYFPKRNVHCGAKPYGCDANVQDPWIFGKYEGAWIFVSKRGSVQ